MPTTYDLVGSAEAADLLEIGPTNFSHLRKKMEDAEDQSFPTPIITLRCGPIWKRSDMDKFKKHYDARRRRVRTNGDAPVAETPKAKAIKAPAKVSAAKAPAKPRSKATKDVAVDDTIGAKPPRKLSLAGAKAS